MKVYIYTIPKAGTYFLADFVTRLGFRNTGFHVSQSEFLNTHKLDHETNIKYPVRAIEKQFFVKTLRGLSDLDLAFGHFPVPLMSMLFPGFFFVCSYRHPRTTLVAEFVDFRFRRADVKRLNRERIPDDRSAFCAYLENEGPGHINIFAKMIGVTLLANEALYQAADGHRFHVLNFDELLKDPTVAINLASALGVDAERAIAALDETRSAETKTKATGLAIDREAFWSDRAEEIYHKLNAEAFVARGRELGWTI